MTASSIDRVFERWEGADSPGFAIAVIEAGEILYSRGYGMSNLEHGIPITTDSIFHIASISKQFTATSIALLDREGSLSLDTDIREYVPEVPDYGETITVRNLVHHTSGIRDMWELLRMAGWRSDDLITEGDMLEIVPRQRAPNFSPGTEWLYSNSGYALLATIVQRVSGKTLREFAEERIFRPLGMTRTHFHDDHTEIVQGRTQAYQPRNGGGWFISIPVFDVVGTTSLFTTVEDLARWDGNFYNPTVGDPALISQIETPGKIVDGRSLDYAFGLRWRTYRGAAVIEHSGGDAGYRAHYLRFPDHRLSVIVLSNLSNGNTRLRAEEVADIVLASALAPQPTVLDATYRATPEELEAKAGIYRNPATGDLVRLAVVHGELRSGFEAQGTVHPLTATMFRLGDDPSNIIEFEDGDAVAFSVLASFNGVVGQPDYFERIDGIVEGDRALITFAGDYWSEELGASWTIDVEGGDVVVRQRKMEPMRMTPAGNRTFARDDIRVQFDEGETPSGFSVSVGRVRGVRFERGG